MTPTGSEPGSWTGSREGGPAGLKNQTRPRGALAAARRGPAMASPTSAHPTGTPHAAAIWCHREEKERAWVEVRIGPPLGGVHF